AAGPTRPRTAQAADGRRDRALAGHCQNRADSTRSISATDAVERVIAGQLSRSALHAAGTRNNPTIRCCKLAFTMTPQAVWQLSPGSVQKIRDACRIGSISFVI